ncbi:uncharacterized protein IL334_000086 [Kwoniella shivajii]|uniref:GH16 domain-containing protein n=1 Tax=Kwoniella shivajii TaxID=564305 RepID=A0ABZ1CNB1_9TREE|nr:hypothetical protein IL334_000086 [Kwoniella shivajii]
MTRSTLLFLGAALLPLIQLISAQTCNSTSLCPSTAPCCSEYGYCGSGSYCLGGCEPLYSFKSTSCRPNPICVSQETNFNDLSKVQLNGTKFDGNATAYDWVVNTGNLIADPSGQGVRLTLKESDQGTKISSTRYIHYGSIDFVLESSKWNGVVTAAITMSDVKDEIDWEWPGAITDKVQTNYWFLGVANYSATQGAAVDIASDSSSNFHTYTFDWQEDYLNWSIDGQVVRTVLKQDTLSDDGTQYKYPSTPSRIQLSIWPAGISTSAQGTIDWSGGMIDWTDPDYVSNGYFWNTLQSVKISCANQDNTLNSTTGWAYGGNDTQGIPIVDITNASTLLSGAEPSILLVKKSTVAVLLSTIGLATLTGIALL